MRVEYRLTLEDAIAYDRAHWKQSPQRKQAGCLAPTLLGLLGFVGLAKYLGDPAPFPVTAMAWLRLLSCLFFAFTFCFCGFMFCFGGIIRELQLRRQLRRDPRFFEPRTLVISEEGLMASDWSAATTILWPAVARIIPEAEYALFYFTETDGFILPRHAFADEYEFEKFVATARRYQQEALRHRGEQVEEQA